MPTSYFNLLKSHINEFGVLVSDINKSYWDSILAAQSLCDEMLGSKLIVKGKSFFLTELEMYYGGVGDIHHDWHRKRFKKNGRAQTNFRAEEIYKQGYRIYISQSKISKGNRRVRMDIIVGNTGVPISFLVRSVCNQDRKLIPGPNRVLKELGFTVEDHGQEISTQNRDSEFYLDLSNKIGGQIVPGLRIGIQNGIENEFDLLWNRTLIV
jgi:3-methyladenine DNA glycosylase Mpg